MPIALCSPKLETLTGKRRGACAIATEPQRPTGECEPARDAPAIPEASSSFHRLDVEHRGRSRGVAHAQQDFSARVSRKVQQTFIAKAMQCPLRIVEQRECRSIRPRATE